MGIIGKIRINSRHFVRLTKLPRGRKHKRRSNEMPAMNKCPKNTKKWSEKSMSSMIKAVIDGKIGVNRAADQYGVPSSTLKDRVSTKHRVRSEPQPYLSYEEEEELVTYLVKCAKTGYPKTKDEVIGIVRQALHKKKGPTLLKNLEEGGGGRLMENPYLQWLH